MAQHIATAIDSRPFSVPNGKHSVVFTFAAHFRLLRAPNSGRSQILIEARHEENVVLFKQALSTMHLRIDAAERRAAVSGDEAGRIQAHSAIHLLLHKQETHDRLRAGHMNARCAEIEFVGERYFAIGGTGLWRAGDNIRHSWSPAWRTALAHEKQIDLSRTRR